MMKAENKWALIASAFISFISWIVVLALCGLMFAMLT
jgi:hypothetical protein